MFKSSFYICILTLCSPINILAMEANTEFDPSDYQEAVKGSDDNDRELDDSNGMEPNLPGLDTVNRELREALEGSDCNPDYEDYTTYGLDTYLHGQIEIDDSEYEKPDIALEVSAHTEENLNAYQPASNQNENLNRRRISQSNGVMTRSPGKNPMQVMPRPQNNLQIRNVAPQQNQNANRGMQPQQFQNGNGGMQPQQFPNANRGMQPQQFPNANRGMQPQQFPNANRGMQPQQFQNGNRGMQPQQFQNGNRGMQPQQFQNGNRGMQPQQFQNGNRGMQPQQFQNGNRGMQPQQFQNGNRGMQPQQFQNGNRGMQPQQFQNGNRGMQPQQFQNGNRGMQPQQFQNGNRGMQPQQNQTRGGALKPITSPPKIRALTPNKGVVELQQNQMIDAVPELNQNPNDLESCMDKLLDIFDEEDSQKKNSRLNLGDFPEKIEKINLDNYDYGFSNENSSEDDDDIPQKKKPSLKKDSNPQMKIDLDDDEEPVSDVSFINSTGDLPETISSNTYFLLRTEGNMENLAKYLQEHHLTCPTTTILFSNYNCNGKMEPWGSLLKTLTWNLKTIQFVSANLHDRDIEILCAHLDEAETLEELSLQGNPITDQSAYLLADKLTGSNALRVLILDNTHISYIGIAPFCSCERGTKLEVSVMGNLKNMSEVQFKLLKKYIKTSSNVNPKVAIKIEDKWANSPHSSNVRRGLKRSKSVNTNKKEVKKNDSPVKVEINEPTPIPGKRKSDPTKVVEFEMDISTPKRKSDPRPKRKTRALSKK